MKVYLAGFKTIEKIWNKPTDDIYLLSSYCEHKNGKYGNYVKNKTHILDSGAFSALTGKVKKINWDNYIENYAAFIKKNNIDLFFELDIDSIVGLSEVERLRDKLEILTAKKCIPVWHKSRGKEYWLRMVKNYDYVAIGGIVTREIKPSQYPYFTYLLEEARKENCKVHGLGFTKTSLLERYKFYSVDSTTWNVGGKFGNLVVFDKKGFPTQRYKKENYRVKDTNKINEYNFEQWVKFQKYADKYL
jgi:hypothetical protein